MNNPDHLAYITALYDQGIHMMDEEVLGTLREWINDKKIADKTVIIITADHGEEFMEHGELQHVSLYDFNIKVPLVLLIPGVTPKTVSEHVQSVDIVPTLLDILGIPTKQNEFNGKSLIPLLSNRTLGQRLIITEGNWQIRRSEVGVRSGDWKVIIALGKNGEKTPIGLYNTKQDPSEQKNLLAQNMNKALEIVRKYREFESSLHVINKNN